MSGFMDNWRASESGWGCTAIEHKQPAWEGWRFVRVMSGDVEVARVWCDEDDAEQAAAVSLIAAAPELLAAVQAYDKARADAVAKTFDNDDETSLAVAILSAEADHRVGHLMMAALRKVEGKA